MATLDWESHKNEIQRLFVQEDKSLDEVMTILSTTENFHAR